MLRGSFYTSYPNPTPERISNIKLATQALNNTVVDVGGEFSFNERVGERTERRGYKKAKIIVGGEFVDGVGGGVCQVSTTLYNAILVSGLWVSEYHAHSLAVGYVAPSFDAMVNSGGADLRFINNTYNPIIIKAKADESTVRIEIYGEKVTEKYIRKSVKIEDIPAPEDEEIEDEKGEYPDLYEGEYRYIRYGKSGIISEGYIVVIENGKVKEERRIRKDRYNGVKGIKVKGRAEREEEKR